MALFNTFLSQKLQKIINDFIWDLTNFNIEMLSTLVPFYVSYSKGRNKSKECFGISMNWTFKNLLTFYLYLLQTGWKKEKKSRKISKILIFWGHPMFGTSAGTSKLRFWPLWKWIQNSWYSNFPEPLLFLFTPLKKWPCHAKLFDKSKR